MASVRVDKLVKRFDQNIAVNQMDLHVKDGEFMVFLGPSGCGKTTTLRCIAGLELPDGGTIHIGDREVTKLPPADRDIAFVFQSFSLYPHLSVRENLAFPLKAVRTAPAEIASRVEAAAKTLHIERLLDRKPDKLSGGEMQRVTIGRAIVRRPQVFLMDEPLSALDAKLRTEMRAEIKRLQTDLRATTIYVTHDQLEAMSMGDRIAIMYGGVLQQMGTPTEVYDHPKNLFVAGFIGSPAMNFLPCTFEGDSFVIRPVDGASGVRLPLLTEGRARLGKASRERPQILGVRPEDVALSREPKPEFQAAEVYLVEPLGSEKIVNLRVAGHILKARTPPTFVASNGDTLYFRLDQARSHVFDAETEQAVSDESVEPPTRGER